MAYYKNIQLCFTDKLKCIYNKQINIFSYLQYSEYHKWKISVNIIKWIISDLIFY